MNKKLFCGALGLAVLVPALTSAFAVARPDYAAVLHAKPNLEHGAELYHHCMSCHGVAGSGTDDGKVPRIGGQHFRVLAKQLVNYRNAGRWDPHMEEIADPRSHLLQDTQAIADVAAYVSRLEWPSRPRSLPRDREEPGAALYTARCQSCHGAKGEGDGGKLVPRLAGQHYEYLARQIYDAVDGRRPDFPRQHVRLLAKLDRDQILDVADFLSRCAWTGPAVR